MKMKYITFKGPICDEIVIFINIHNHSDMAQIMGIQKDELLGAGFVDFEHMRCIGKSTSLGIDSRPADTDLLERHAFPDDY